MSDRLRRVIHAFSAVADLGVEIADTSDFDEMVTAALQVVLGALGVRRGTVGEYDAESGLLRFVAARGHAEGAPPQLPFSPMEAEALTGGEGAAVCVEGGEASAGQKRVSLSERFLAELGRSRVRLLVPLLVHGRLEGVILLARRRAAKVHGRGARRGAGARPTHRGGPAQPPPAARDRAPGERRGASTRS